MGLSAFPLPMKMSVTKTKSTVSSRGRRTRSQRRRTTWFGPDEVFSDTSSDDDDDDTGCIPEIYVTIIDKIEESGWNSIEWEHGYNLLHWSAKNNIADLCMRLIANRANPDNRDHLGNDAFDYARENNSMNALKTMMAGIPEDMEPPVLMMPISVGRRKSQTVTCQFTPKHRALLQFER